MPIGKTPDEIPTDQYVKAFDWLCNFQTSSEWEALTKAKGLVKPAQWEMYKAMEITGLREQAILDVAQIAIRKLWKRNRPSFFGRTYKPKENDSENQTPAAE